MSDVLVEKEGNLLKLTLNRPAQMNALSDEMKQVVLDEVMDVITNKSARAILLSGAGKGFCAGADLQGDSLASRREKIEGYMMAGVNKMVQALHEVPVPVIVALNGPAAGAGCGLALAGDLIIASQSAKLVTAFSRIGAVLDGGMSWALTHKVGPARAMGMAMFGGKAITAQQALEWGLVWEVVEDDKLQERSLELARTLADGPTVALGLIKRQIAYAQNNSIADVVRFEAACQAEAFRSEDFPEGVTAFQQKRKPNFLGK
ncbi:enoyl-CoA hydratase/isomerase family protein [Sneathiella limimaris]|uniref:enoyl-CoA hydratase/isomerase family protein n=1 Tax=Sneathiella limimaris TaxID=1964213 RepID=UPI00146B5D0D|nr:enoyl-CoA hydratase-related protein [Sneathiella limimaris]